MNELCTKWIELSDREAVGDALGPDEQAFMHSHQASCPACGAEQAAWSALGAVLTREQPAAAPALPMASHVHAKRWSPFALSAACALLLGTLGFGVSHLNELATGREPAAESATATRVPSKPQTWTVRVAANSRVEVDGKVVAAGTAIAVGALVSATEGIACLHVDPDVRVCLARNSRMRVAELSDARRRLELLSGRIVSELAPQPAGSSFGVLTRAGSAVAVGTAFSVEISEDGSSTVTRVSHGTVLVNTQVGERRVPAHQMAFMDGRVAALSAGDELYDWALLDAREPSPALVAALTPPGATPESAAPVQAREPAAASASALLRAARLSRAQGDVQRASDSYRLLLSRHARTREAQVARVAYGELLLSRGEASAGLDAFEQYLAHGGPLAEEAGYDRLKALEALGRRDAERAGIQAFLRTFPESPRASALAVRLRALGSP